MRRHIATALRPNISQASGLARGKAYLDGLALETRRRGGQVYTPPHLVQFILRQAGFLPTRSIESLSLLDPACGAGAFLSQAIHTLADRMARLDIDVGSRTGRLRWLRAISGNFYGIDVDPHACQLARAAVRDSILSRSPGRLPEGFFDQNIICADFLFSPAVAMLEPIRSGGFRYIVGNPPYVATTRLTDSYKQALRRCFLSARGRLDLYTAFIERALSLLTPNGFLAFVTPDKFLISQTARQLRTLVLERSAVRTLATFRSHRVFRNAATVPCVTVFERAGAPASVTVLTCGDHRTNAGRVAVLARTSVEPSALSPQGWDLRPPDLARLAERIQGNHPTLDQWTTRISAGLATGRDNIYVRAAGADWDVEPDLIHPAVRGRDLSPYVIADPKLDILIPYAPDSTGRPILVRLSSYPRARRYLEQHQMILERRHCVRVWGRPWYDLHDPVTFDLARQLKILVPDVARSNRFVLDSGRYCPLHSAYFLVPKRATDAEYLTAILNSRVIELLIRLRAPIVKDGFRRYRRQFLITLPIPRPSASQQRSVVSAAYAGDSDLLTKFVSDLFQLSAPQLKQIDRLLDSSDT